MRDIFTVSKHDGALVLSAIVQDGKACGPFRRERVYYGYGVCEAKKLFKKEMKSNGVIFNDERGY